MDLKLLIHFIILIYEIRCSSENAQKTTIRLNVEGNPNPCSQCDGQHHTFLSDGNYTCDSMDTWNSGYTCAFPFNDPIPPNNLITTCSLNVAGRFNVLNQDEGVSVLYFMGGSVINSVTMPVEPAGMDCPHCVRQVEVDANTAWKPVYNYGGENVLNLRVSAAPGSVCISYIDLTLYYAPENPDVNFIFPSRGPLGGGTNVTVLGSGFDQNLTPMCLFGNQSAPGNVQSSTGGTSLSCITPTYDSQGVTTSVPFGLSIAGNPLSTPFSYIFYEQPLIHQLVPSQGNSSGGFNITIHGEGFLNYRNLLQCLFGSDPNSGVKVVGHFLNDSAILCEAIPGGTGDVEVSVTENGQQWTNPLNFSYIGSSEPIIFPKAHKQEWYDKIPGWALIIGFFGICTCCVIVFVAAGRKIMRTIEEDPTKIPLLRDKSYISEVNFVKQIDINDIKIMEKIGKGTFGEVCRGIWNGTNVAVKFLISLETGDEQFIEDFNREVIIMRSMRHPNILQFLGACSIAPNICIVMEYMKQGSLYRLLHSSMKLPLFLLKSMLMDAAKGMNYLHRSDPVIIHRDLKSHNLLVDENNKVKVCDFGLSKILTADNHMTACGTPSWTAPEILRSEKYTIKADVYSFGIVLWEVLTRQELYEGMPPFQVVLAVGTKEMRPPIPKNIFPGWESLMTRCWAENPDTRPVFDSIITELETLEDEKNESLVKETVVGISNSDSINNNNLQNEDNE